MTSQGPGKATEIASLVAALRARGLDVTPAGDVSKPFFDVDGSLLKVNDAEVHVFEFADEAASNAARVRIESDGNPPNAIVEWIAPPHFYRSGKIVVVYMGKDAKIIEVS